jgi:hypothetical protein
MFEFVTMCYACKECEAVHLQTYGGPMCQHCWLVKQIAELKSDFVYTGVVYPMQITYERELQALGPRIPLQIINATGK